MGAEAVQAAVAYVAQSGRFAGVVAEPPRVYMARCSTGQADTGARSAAPKETENRSHQITTLRNFDRSVPAGTV